MILAETYKGNWKSFLPLSRSRAEIAAFLGGRQGACSWIGDVRCSGPLAAKKGLKRGKTLVRLQTAPWKTTCHWQATTKDGESIDVAVTIFAEIEPELFLKKWRGAIVDKGFDDAILKTQWVNDLKFSVTQKIAYYEYKQLKEMGALQIRWWEEQLRDRLQKDHVQLNAVNLQYSKPNETALRILREKEENDKNRLALYRLENETRIETMKIAARYEENRRRIEFELEASNEERRRELNRVKNAAALDYLENRMKFEETKRELEERNRSRIDASASPDEIRDIELRIAESTKKIAELSNVYEDVQARADAGLFVSPQLTADSEKLFGSAAYCETVDPQFFSRFFNAKAEENPELSVRVNLADVRDPDIRDADSLRIGDHVQLAVLSPISGYLTLLNLGTDGTCCLMLPNKAAPCLHVEARRTFYAPKFGEKGPIGWEEFVAVVSPEPLFERRELVNLNQPENYVVPLSNARLNALLTTLADLASDRWSAGVFGFYVDVDLPEN